MGDTLVSTTGGPEWAGEAHTAGAVPEGDAGAAAARRRARRLAAREFRPRGTVIGLVAAPLLLAAGGVATVEVVTALVGEPAGLVPVDRWAAWLRAAEWGDPTVRRTAAAVAATGALLLCALLPRRRPRTLPLRGAGPLMTAAIGRRNLQRALAGAALGVPGVIRARVRVRGGRFRRRVTVRAFSGYRNPANVQEMVRDAVEARLAEMGLMDGRRVHVRLTWRKD
ncbi:DUF6286 domain-containing protein [Spirillospora sp. CA-255316]